MAKTTKPQRHSLNTEDRTGAALAASVGLAVLSAAKTDRWSGLEHITDKQWAGVAGLDLTADQQRALDEWSAVLPVLRTKPLQTVYHCDTCGRWAVVGSGGGVPNTCNLTWSCAGRTMKGSAAKKVALSVYEPSADVTQRRFADLADRITSIRAAVHADLAALAKSLDDRIAEIKPTIEWGERGDLPDVGTIFLDSDGVRVRVPRTDHSRETVGRIRELLACLPINPVLAKPDPWDRASCKVPAAAARKVDLDALADAADNGLDEYLDDGLAEDWNAAVAAHMADVATAAWDQKVEALVLDVTGPEPVVIGVDTDDDTVDRDGHDAWTTLDGLARCLDSRVADPADDPEQHLLPVEKDSP